VALDTSSSIVGSRLQAVKAAALFITDWMRTNTDVKYDVRFVSWSDSVKSSKQYRKVTSDNIDSLEVWIGDLTSGGLSTNFGAALSQAEAFFEGTDPKKTQVIIVVSDNANTLADPISGVSDAVDTIDALGD
ncbi:VWA domain-containing protein, partial [Mesorhizobium sp. M3A.F.Ca.ET.175.01.1.1]